jgi:DNA repair photolyase
MPLIYRPQGEAGEYAYLAINHIVGCRHGCQYCYASKMAKQFGNPNFFTVQTIKENAIEQLETEALTYAGTNERVLLCFSCDPYQPIEDDSQITRQIIKILKENRIPFQVLTKGGMRAARDFDLYGPDDAFAVTMTMLNEKSSKLLEPFAATPAERIESLRLAHEKGITTWVSLEPVLDANVSLAIIKETFEFVDHYKIGMLNYQKSDINWRKFGEIAIDLCRKVKRSYYIKKGLAKFLDGIPFYSVDTRKVHKEQSAKEHRQKQVQGVLF